MCPVPVTASTWHLFGETLKRYGSMLHLHSQILRGMNKINAWFGWLNSMSAPVRMSVWYNSQRGFYCHQRKICSSKIHLSCFRWKIQIQLISPTRAYLSSLTMIISATNVCSVQCLPLVRQISYWLRAQIINVPEDLHQAFFDYTILLHMQNQCKLHYFTTYSQSSWFLTNV